MHVDTASFQALTAEVLARLDAVEARLAAATAAEQLLDRIKAEAEPVRPRPPRDRHGLRLIGGGRS